MASPVEVLLWAWVILDQGEASVSLPEIPDGRFIEECVREHNRARSSVSPAASSMLHMTWDESLAVTAAAWARNCLFEHNPFPVGAPAHPTFSSVGENLWTGSLHAAFDVTGAIKRWVDERHQYGYDSNTCTGVCGHYTQVVWASSYKVGCAVQLCPNGVRHAGFAAKEAVIFVCNYGPAGNVNGSRPYESGAAAGSDESNYVPVLVVRPIALILTFFTAYAVRYFYPDIFCYE